MNRPAARSPKRFWYKISVDALKGWLVMLALAVLAVVGYQGYRILGRHLLEREVTVVMEEARELIQSLSTETGLGSYRGEYDSARHSLQTAHTRAEGGQFEEALKDAERSRSLAQSILNALHHRGRSVEARFISVQGGVEYRRGEQGEWQAARGRTILYPGDYVKTTSRGSAEIMLVDGTVYTVRSDSVILVDRTRLAKDQAPERTIALEYGWVDLSTSKSGGHVRTPAAEARIERDSRATVGYDQERKIGRYAAFQGGMEVTSNDGRKLKVGELQQVVQQGDRVSAVQPLPVAPLPLEPADNLEIYVSEQREVILAWEAVEGAKRYALQVSRNRLFVENIIDVENRSKTRATLGVQGTGSFLWRVAAVDEEGAMGPWSSPRRFRVTSKPEVAS